MPLAYLDTPSGISGDIFLGCLIDAGWPLASLHAAIDKLNLPGGSWRVSAETVSQGGLRATRVSVEISENNISRKLADVHRIVGASGLQTAVKRPACAVFARLAAAEAFIHNTTPDDVHFHEVGALDAIIDIVGVCAGLHELGINPLYASALPLGHGWTESMHGRIPLPAPATLALLANANAPTVPAPGPGELVTPTGAALVAELAEFRLPAQRLRKIGYGAGQKVFAWPNIARLWLGDGLDESPGQPAAPSDSLVVIETNIDDMSPELYQPVQALLFDNGALDVWTSSIAMKKGRPATLLSVLASQEDESDLATLLLRQTTTLGVRVYPVRRHIAARHYQTVSTAFGPVRVKVKELDGRNVGVKPEFEDCRRLAEATATPLTAVYAAAQAAASPLLSSDAALRPRPIEGKAAPNG